MLANLRQWWHEPGVANPSQPTVRDRLLAGSVAAIAVLQALLEDLTWSPVAILFGFVLAWVTVHRARRPLLCVIVAFGGFALLDVAAIIAGAEPITLYAGIVVLLLPYALFRWGSVRAAVVGVPFLAAPVLVVALTQPQSAAENIGGAGVLAVSAVLGLAVRYRASARSRMIDQARLQERHALARELHDSVAHHVSAIAIQAQVGQLSPSHDVNHPASAALQRIETEAATALAEMRAIVGALRDPVADPSLVSGRGLEAMSRLAGSGVGGERIQVQIAPNLPGLPLQVEAALARIAQESVTNALRHAQGMSQVKVQLSADTSSVFLKVTNDGQTARVRAAGFGLIGMRERADLLGGDFEAGPSASSGWVVRATLPLDRGAA